MIDLGLKLSAEKTKTSTSLIEGAIKDDKLYWLKQKQLIRNPQKQLLIIHDLSMKFPNCGSLLKALNDFRNKLRRKTNLSGSINPLISILVAIALKSPRIYSQVVSIISVLLKFEKDFEKKETLLEKIIYKFEGVPNTGHLELFLQRLIVGIGKENTEFEAKFKGKFEEPLCRLVEAKKYTPIWSLEWLEEKNLKKIVDQISIIDEEEKKKLTEEFTKKEVALFHENNFYSYE